MAPRYETKSILFSLPPEPRLGIYQLLVGNGSLDLVRTSKRVYDEAMYLVYELRSCHMKVGGPIA